MSPWLSADQTGLAVACGAGLLIGLERERRKGQGDDRQAAGVRTFMVAALAGAIAQILSAAMAALVLAGVGLLAALSYWRSRSRDPGLTTELALVATALIGILAAREPALAAGCAVVLAGVLAARDRLHRFATEWLSERELHDALLLAALALVLLPLLPAAPLGWLGQLSPRRVLMLVILILLMQAAGHVARRLLGPRAGLALSGLLGGFVSSTATISAMGGLVRQGQVPLRLAWCAAVLSMVATWVQLWLMASVVSPGVASSLWPLALVGAAGPLLLGLALWRRSGQGQPPTHQPKMAAEPGPDQMPGAPQSPEGVLRPREAVLVAALLAGGAVLVSLAQDRGQAGLMLGTALAAMADAHAPMAGLMALAAAGQLDPALLSRALLMAVSVNGLTRGVAACVAGGARFGAGVAVALAFNVAVGWAFVLLSA